MDYSTISNKTNCTEVEDITNSELSERYYILKKQHENLSSNYEATKQELHEIRRDYQIAVDAQLHLTTELEILQADEERRKIEYQSRITALQEDISALRTERAGNSEQHLNEVQKLERQIQILKEEQAFKTRESPVRDNSELEEAKEAVTSALTEAATAKAALENAKLEIVQWQAKVEELVNEMAEMRVAVDLRREELRAANERETVALADLAEARAMLHQCNDNQDLQPHAAKGNSIFAEVEDKRQEMAKNLIQMKQKNSRLRRELANKQAEVDALLHEKQTIWEQQSGAEAHYDRELIESYEKRITQLEGVCERQRRELAKWFGKACEPTANGWMSAVIDHLKTECNTLRAEVISSGAIQLANAAQVRELRRKLARLTANSAKKSPSDKQQLNSSNDKDEIEIKKVPIQVTKNSDDVKKKVSFN
ncbi:hypothetical protein K1T71_004744 [Dendrolimus kikuchii]|uniref:Uncharacterized protein n=1 Tax=Dendrolimus kikuchii TaxID=765133 RepID=A0ACC1D8B4_9NEOP|nr:hypothetical protein K1T71_004744 [Dendrolimus kikuchii]